MNGGLPADIGCKNGTRFPYIPWPCGSAIRPSQFSEDCTPIAHRGTARRRKCRELLLTYRQMTSTQSWHCRNQRFQTGRWQQQQLMVGDLQQARKSGPSTPARSVVAGAEGQGTASNEKWFHAAARQSTWCHPQAARSCGGAEISPLINRTLFNSQRCMHTVSAAE